MGEQRWTYLERSQSRWNWRHGQDSRVKAEVKAMVRNIEAGSLSGMAENEGFSAPLSPLSGECDDEAVDAVDYSMVYPVFDQTKVVVLDVVSDESHAVI